MISVLGDVASARPMRSASDGGVLAQRSPSLLTIRVGTLMRPRSAPNTVSVAERPDRGGGAAVQRFDDAAQDLAIATAQPAVHQGRAIARHIRNRHREAAL